MNSPLELIDIDKNFDHPSGEIKVLQQCQLKVTRGETLAILGPSGSGKSTLLSILAGLDRPTRGQVKVMGEDLNAMNEADLTRHRAKHLGIVFQQFHLMTHLTALENVALPMQLLKRDSANALAEEALNKVGLSHRLKHFPHECSGGECQRIAIARAMVMEPDIILADEPSGNLDESTGDQVMNLLFDLVERSQSTLILVTHNKELAKQCQRQLLLSQGKLGELS